MLEADHTPVVPSARTLGQIDVVVELMAPNPDRSRMLPEMTLPERHLPELVLDSLIWRARRGCLTRTVGGP